MKRDFDLIRLLLSQIESANSADNLRKYTDDQIKYHEALLVEAGFIEGKVKYSSCRYKENIPEMVYIKRMTWEGHEFLDKIRKDNVWKKVKDTIISKGLDLSIESVMKVSSQYTLNVLS